MDADAESLISHLCCGLAPADRAAFRRAAETALANSPQCSWGPGSVYRVIVPLWRSFFHPPTMEGRTTAWEQNRKKLSKLITGRRGRAALSPHSDRAVSMGY